MKRRCVQITIDKYLNINQLHHCGKKQLQKKAYNMAAV